MKKLVHAVLVVTCTASLLSCGGEKEFDKIGDAQYCLDRISGTGNVAEVNACLEKVDGLTSPGAEGIRCAGAFIRENLVGQRIINAFDAISSGTSSSGMQTLMGILTFTSVGTLATDLGNVQNAFSSCLASGGKGSTLLVSISYLTMAMVNFFSPAATVGTCSGNPCYDLNAAVTSSPAKILLFGDPATADPDAAAAQSSVGAIIVAANRVSCAGTGANKDLCAVFSDAITAAGGESNTRQVAVKLFQNTLGY